VRAAAKGRRICVAIGRQDRDKGFDQFVRFWLDNPALRDEVLFVCGGKVVAELGDLAQAFEEAGGLAFNRFITDEELFDLYAVSDMVVLLCPHLRPGLGHFRPGHAAGYPGDCARSIADPWLLPEPWPVACCHGGADRVGRCAGAGRARRCGKARARGLDMARQSIANLRGALGLT
jgi:hypothetical protein